MCRLSVT